MAARLGDVAPPFRRLLPRAAYEAGLLSLMGEVSAGLDDLPAAERELRAIALLALLSGGVTLARAVHDPVSSERIAKAVGRYAMMIAEPAAIAPKRKTP